jgi:hypothetical protein
LLSFYCSFCYALYTNNVGAMAYGENCGFDG